MFTHVWDNHYSLIKIMGCLTHWWTHCMSFLCYRGLRSLFWSSCCWPLKRYSKTNLYGSIPLHLNIRLLTRVAGGDGAYHWSHWGGDGNTPGTVCQVWFGMCWWTLLGHHTSGYWPWILTLKMSDMLCILSLQHFRFTQCTTRFCLFLIFFTLSTLSVLFLGCAP